MHGIARRDRDTRVYRCARDRAEAAERCTCRRCEASSLEAAVWTEVVAVLTNPERLLSLAQTAMNGRPDAEAAEDEDLSAIDRRIHRLEKGLGSTVAGLVRRGMDVAAIDAATGELESDLLRLRQHRATVEAWQLASRDKADRMQRLHSLARRAEQVLADPSPDIKRRVLELLDVRVRIMAWLPCDACGGKGFVSAGFEPRTRTRGATGVPCPACRRHRFIPAVEISGVVPESMSSSTASNRNNLPMLAVGSTRSPSRSSRTTGWVPPSSTVALHRMSRCLIAARRSGSRIGVLVVETTTQRSVVSEPAAAQAASTRSSRGAAESRKRSATAATSNSSKASVPMWLSNGDADWAASVNE